MVFKPWVLIVCTSTAFLESVPARAQMRSESSVSLSGGLYAASGFGTNPYFAARYNHFLMGGKFFVEGLIGSQQPQIQCARDSLKVPDFRIREVVFI